MALTIIDTVTNYPEIIRIHNKTAAHVALQFGNAWLSCYPHPIRCIFDQGPEFIGSAFQNMLILHGIKPVPTTIKNHKQVQLVSDSIKEMEMLSTLYSTHIKLKPSSLLPF